MSVPSCSFVTGQPLEELHWDRFTIYVCNIGKLRESLPRAPTAVQKALKFSGATHEMKNLNRMGK